MSKRHVMLDIETMSSDSYAAIVQIGACQFNVGTQEISELFEVNIKLADARALGFHVDPATEQWWANQSQAAIDSIMAEPRLSVREGLQRFYDWYPRNAVVWSHATFDAVIVQNAYKKVGMPMPWHFRDARDLRTLNSIFAFGGRMVPEELWNPPGLTPHRASHDAKRQAMQAIYMLRRVFGIEQ